jgi:low temperature requirement protein LtrA
MGPVSRPGRALVHDVRVSEHAEVGEGRLHATLRGNDERVLPLELFFDLVFVLAITQCTALMAHEPTWAGIGKGLLVLGILWWTWIGYAWLTSVVDPEEGVVRLLILVAMAGLLVVSLCVPHAFDEHALLFACAITIVRIEHIVLFMLGSRDDPGLRSSVIGLAGSTAVGCALLIAGSFAGDWQPWIWLVALVLDMSGPKFFGLDGWRLVPGHYAERFGLIVLIALGESIVAIGAGSGQLVDAGIVVAATLGVAVSASLFWLYFDVVALVAARRLSNATPGREQNGIARDSFTYLHLPMVAGIVLVALGFKKTLAHVHADLHVVPATALLGGTALYLLAHVAFRWRNVHRFSLTRLCVAGLCVALIPLAVHIPALGTIAVLAGVLIALIVYERLRFAELRQRLRHQLAE